MTPLTTVPDPRAAWHEARTGPEELITGGMLLAGVMLGTWAGWLPGMALLAVGLLGLVAAFVNPRIFLLAYVALIPFEGSTAFGGITNLSRFAGIAFAAGYVVHRRTAIRLDTIPAAGWAFVGVVTASFLWSIDRTSSLPQILTMLQLFVIALLIADYIVQEERAARWVALAYAVAAVGTALTGLWIWTTARSTLVAGRATAFPGQDAAQFTSVLIPGLLVLVWETLRRPRVLPIIGAGIIAIAILASGTRSAWVATALAVAAGFVPRISTRQRIGVAGALGAVALAAFVIPPLYTETYGRLSDAISSGGTGRIDIWIIGLRLWTDHAVVGVGFGAFPTALTLEAIRATAIPTPDTGFLTPPVGSHSIIVGTLLELGVVGFGCVVAFMWSVARPRRDDVSLAGIARLAVLTMLVQALFLDILGRKQLWLFIALAGGLTVARALRQRAAAAEAAGAASDGPEAADVREAVADAGKPHAVAAMTPPPGATLVVAPVSAPVVAWVRSVGAGRHRDATDADRGQPPAEVAAVTPDLSNIVIAPPPTGPPRPPQQRRPSASSAQLDVPVEAAPAIEPAQARRSKAEPAVEPEPEAAAESPRAPRTPRPVPSTAPTAPGAPPEAADVEAPDAAQPPETPDRTGSPATPRKGRPRTRRRG